jgi:hypothetical protein
MSLDMNPEIRAQWCAALRGGEYAQTREALRRLPGDSDVTDAQPVGYCCLGVLTDLYVKDGNLEDYEDHGWEQTVWDADGVLASPVRDWAGLFACNPSLTPALTASDVNDGGGTFAEIADLIDGGQPEAGDAA